jgi:hypothetical protein
MDRLRLDRSMQVTWRENLFLTTTTTQFGRGKLAEGERRYWDSGD